MAKKEENAIVKAGSENALVPAAPSYVEDGRVGYDNVVDMTFERLTLLQAMSPELVKNQELRAGMLYRRSTGEVLFTPGSSPIAFTIAYYFKEWVEFGDREDPKSNIVIARTTDPSSKLAEEARQWVKKKVSKGEVRKVTDVHNFIVLREGSVADPIMVTAMRSNARYGTGLLNLANGRGQVPIFAGRYLMYTEQETNRRNQTFFVTKFKNPPKTAEEYWASRETYEAAKTLNQMLSDAHKSGKLGGNYQEDDRGEATADAEL